MVIKGKERNFLLTVQAANEIAEFCPNNDFNRFAEITADKNFSEICAMDLKIAAILINEYEQNKAMENAGYKPDIINLDDLASRVTPFWVKQLETEIIKAIMRDAFGQIETEETKEAKKTKKNEKRGS